MRFPTYPRDILSRADALLSSKYPDGIVDPRFVEVACEAMMAEQERCAKIAESRIDGTDFDLEPEAAVAENVTAKGIAKAIRGTE